MLELLLKRRSIRKYKDKLPEKDKLEKLIKCLLLSPSSRNLRPWEFIVIDDKPTIEKLAKSKEHGSSFLSGAPLVVVVLGQPEKSDVWIEDTAIASTILQLAAQDLELASCWVQIRERMHDTKTSSEDYVRSILNIPPNLRVESIIALGYPAEKKEPQRPELLDFAKIHLNTYQQKTQ